MFNRSKRMVTIVLAVETLEEISNHTDFRISQSNMKSENGFHLREIRPLGGFQLRNPNPDFLDFPFCRSIGKSDIGFAKLFS